MTDRPMDDIVDFWFDEASRPFWFNSSPHFDRLVAERMLPLHRQAVAGALDDWRNDVDGTLALCLLFDQAPRNCFRGSPAAFATDEKARAVARRAVETGFDMECVEEERLFLYLPFMHHEDVADQNEAVRLIAERCPSPVAVRAAEQHREIIIRFGRFPHRNIALGRETTAEEREFLLHFDGF